MNQHFIVDTTTCAACNANCGGACGRNFLPTISTPENTQTAPVSVTASQSIDMGYPLGRLDATGLYTAYNPDGTDGSQKLAGIAQHPIVTDTNGRLTNFQNMWVVIPSTWSQAVIFTRGEFVESLIAGNDQNIIEAMISSGRLVRLPNGYVRLN